MTDSEEPVTLPSPLENLATIAEHPERFATHDKNIREVALDATKFIFDLSINSEKASIPHISSILASLNPNHAPQTRSKTKAGRPKAGLFALPTIGPTPLESLFVNGMDEEQVWEQLNLRSGKICELLGKIFEEQSAESGSSEEGDDDDDEMAGFDDNEEEFTGFENDEDMNIDGELELSEGDSYQEDEDSEGESGDDGEDEELGEDVTPLRGESDEEEEHPPSMFDLMRDQTSSRPKKRKSAHGLNDEFFDLDAFNAETERLEARKVSSGGLGGGEEDSDSDLSVDLFTPVDFTESQDEEELEDDASTLFYKDFFEPPSKQLGSSPLSKKKAQRTSKVRFHDEVRVQKIKARGKNLPLSAMHPLSAALDEDEDGFGENFGFDNDELSFDEDDGEEEEIMGFNEDSVSEDLDTEDAGSDESSSEDGDEADDVPTHMRDTIERLKDDLFAEDEVPDDDLTTHERRMKDLRDQIEALESENVTPKEWVLMGEATSRSRPLNSLLEEDLEFERVMKAVPVVTEERVQALEDRIKDRIMASNFDDVIRRRPVDEKPFLPSRLLEISDSKSNRSLAQIYEDEYSAAQNGGVAGEDRDGKLKKEHEDITRLWENICGKLDALCNAHFTPKAPTGTISAVENVSTATLESALPTSRSATSILAPEEVFSAPTDMRARSEITPAESKSLRLKRRKNKKRMRDTLEKGMDKVSKMKGISGVKKQKQAALESVVKLGKGVTVIGKKREAALKKENKGRKS